ncbi:MAG TPA: formate dehydrogenase accessory protein FdhE [Candidatus Binatia bacterium]|jgi:FdhE protein|nr:formate dehydrogenase accessory protein FdhE [Candidatus Binatia bacterium]
MTASESRLQDLKRRHPEWEPWLTVVQEVLRESADSRWAAVVPPIAATPLGKTPLIAEARIVLPKSLLRAWFEQLIRVAQRSGTDKLATLKAALDTKLDIFKLFKASLQQDDEFVKKLATSVSADAEAFAAVTALLPVPLLQATNRRWAQTVASSWMEGYCPVCGAWPAFAETRGIERNRYLRCGRCGAEWQAHVLSCPYCGNTDHERLVSLISENSAKSAIDACKVCVGYVKVFTTLQGTGPDAVMLEDLGSVEIDLAAADQGYRRPKGPGYSVDVTVSA